MICRQTLFTDERMGDGLFDALARLPEGSGVLFRHKSLARNERAALGERVAAVCRERHLILSVSEDVALARVLGAVMVHKPTSDPGDLRFSLPVHDGGEALAARQSGAALIYVSPVFPTASHPGAPHLGPELARQFAIMADRPAIALGGMTEQRFEALDQDIFSGWAAIDAWLAEKNRA